VRGAEEVAGVVDPTGEGVEEVADAVDQAHHLRHLLGFRRGRGRGRKDVGAVEVEGDRGERHLRHLLGHRRGRS
jgi:hypothetical protein